MGHCVKVQSKSISYCVPSFKIITAIQTTKYSFSWYKTNDKVKIKPLACINCVTWHSFGFFQDQ